MGYQLGDATLPRPKSLSRRFIEVSKTNNTLTGYTTWKRLYRKSEYRLTFTHLTTSQVNSILSEYELDQPRQFVVDDNNMSIDVSVLIDLPERKYLYVDPQARQTLDLILTEVI